MRKISRKTKMIAGASGVALAVMTGGTAFAWFSLGGGHGSASTGAYGVTISLTPLKPLTPDVWRDVVLKVKNPGDDPIKVGKIDISVDPSWHKGKCSAGDFRIQDADFDSDGWGDNHGGGQGGQGDNHGNGQGNNHGNGQGNNQGNGFGGGQGQGNGHDDGHGDGTLIQGGKFKTAVGRIKLRDDLPYDQRDCLGRSDIPLLFKALPVDPHSAH